MVKSRVPGDLILIVSGVLLTNLFVFSSGFMGDGRVLLVLLMFLFLPGYAMVSALFPRKDEISGAERITFSIGLSVALVPFIGYGLLYTSWGMNIEPLMISISLLILVMCALALFRRSRLPEEVAFSFSPGSVYRSFMSSVSGRDSRLETGLTALLLVSILISAVTVTYIIANPKQGEGFTEFYILGPEGFSGGYPTSLNVGESGSVIVGTVNQENRAVDYRLAVLLDGTPLPLQPEEENIHLENDERWEKELSFTPEVPGNDMKLQFLLYSDEDLSEPYRELHLWIDVNGSGTMGN